MNKIRINQGRVVMWQFRIAGTLLVFFIGALALLKLGEVPAIFVFITVSFLLPLLWSSYYIFELKPAEGIILEYYWIAGIKFKEAISRFSLVEKIFVNEVRMAQDYHNFFGSARTVKSVEYRAFLKVGDGNKFFMLSDTNPQRLREKFVPIAKKLNCDLVENFLHEPSDPRQHNH